MVHEKLVDFFKGFKSGSHPMGIMLGVVAALSTFLNVSSEKDFDIRDPRHREYISIKVIAKMPTIAAYAFRTAMGLPIVYPKKEYGFTKNFLYMLFHNPMDTTFNIDEGIIKALDVIFILHADHE